MTLNLPPVAFRINHNKTLRPFCKSLPPFVEHFGRQALAAELNETVIAQVDKKRWIDPI